MYLNLIRISTAPFGRNFIAEAAYCLLRHNDKRSKCTDRDSHHLIIIFIHSESAHAQALASYIFTEF